VTALPEPARRPLPALAGEIRNEVEAAESAWQDAVGHAIRAGELLIEAKAQVKHGEWLSWLEANFPGFSGRSASNCMRLARNRDVVAHLPTIREAVAELTAPKSGIGSSVADLPPDDDDHIAWVRFYFAEIERISRERAEKCLALADRMNGSVPLAELAEALRRYGHLVLADPVASELGEVQAEARESLGLALAAIDDEDDGGETR
jgi:Protein of unknown function (DUF3102)